MKAHAFLTTGLMNRKHNAKELQKIMKDYEVIITVTEIHSIEVTANSEEV